MKRGLPVALLALSFWLVHEFPAPAVSPLPARSYLAHYVFAGFNKGGGGGVTFTLVQHAHWGSTGNGCAAATCAVTVSQPTTGNLLVVIQFGFSGAGGQSSSAPSSSPSAGTWVNCPSAAQLNKLNAASTAFVDADCYYVLSAAASGPTSITCNWSGSMTDTTCDVIEVSRSSGSWTYDTSSSATDTTCTTCAGRTLTLTGTDYVIGWGGGVSTTPSNTMTAPGGQFASFGDTANHGTQQVGGGVAGANGIASVSAYNWTQGTTDVLPVGAIGFK